jgi:hypothetical protein
MKLFVIGLLLMIGGVPLMSVNFKIGMYAIVLGGVLSAWFGGEATKSIISKVISKSQQARPPQRSTGSASTKVSSPSDPATASLLRAIEERRREDPLIGAKLGAKEINQRLINAMKGEKGVHVESFLCALGSLAGYACQANLRAQSLEKGLPQTSEFIVVETKDGAKYFFGDPLNAALAESQHSVWSLAAGAAQHNGASTLPDVAEIFKHVTESVGGEAFGVPRVPEAHRAGDAPINYLKVLWPKLLPVVKQFCAKSGEWPVLYGLAIQEAIDMSKSVIAPEIAVSLVMESAIPMSKVDLDRA